MSPSSHRPASVLLIEDDENLRVGLRFNLEDAGYVVAAVGSAVEAQRLLKDAQFDVLILDVMLPGEDGYTLCRRLRANGLKSMVLMLTARTLEDDIVRGFEAGAQDYLTKPYRLRELLARVSALLRRAQPAESALAFDVYTVDVGRRSVCRAAGAEIELTRTEFELLVFMLRNRDRVLTRDEILNQVWGQNLVIDPRTVDNFVSSLKKKLGWTSASKFAVHSIRGVGYRFEAEVMTKP